MCYESRTEAGPRAGPLKRFSLLPHSSIRERAWTASSSVLGHFRFNSRASTSPVGHSIVCKFARPTRVIVKQCPVGAVPGQSCLHGDSHSLQWQLNACTQLHKFKAIRQRHFPGAALAPEALRIVSSTSLSLHVLHSGVPPVPVLMGCCRPKNHCS